MKCISKLIKCFQHVLINDLICVFFIANKNMIYCFQGAKGTIAGQEGITRSTFTCFVDFCQCLNFVIVCNWYL